MAEGIALITELLRRALSDFAMLAAGDRVLVAVSGGQDSVALLALLSGLPADDEVELVVGHYNHGLRPEAAAEERFVMDLAEGFGCRVLTGRGDVAAYARANGLNLEAAGRELRYGFLREQAEAAGCNKIALGHTASDVAETLLMNLLRGAGIDGLASIAPVRDNMIRPLVYLSRNQTAQYCNARELGFCLDSSNVDTEQFHRNHIRHHLLPALERDYGPGVQQALLRAALAVRDELDWTADHVREALTECQAAEEAPVSLLVSAAAQLPAGLLHRVLRLACTEANLDIRAFGWEHWQGMANTIYGEAGSGQISLPGGLVARRQYELFFIEQASEAASETPQVFRLALKMPGKTKLPDGGFVSISRKESAPAQFPASDGPGAVLDGDAAGAELYVRPLRPGDRFRPLGMSGTKKVSDFLIDEKVPADRRGSVLAVVDSNDEILWLVGCRISQVAAIGPETALYYYVNVSGRKGCGA